MSDVPDDQVAGVPSDGTPSTDAQADAAAGTGKGGSAARRPTPAASAASRARRIGGATGTHKIATTQAQPEPAGISTGPAPAADERVSIRKRQPRTTSARDLKAEAQAGPFAVTQVPEWLRWAPAVVLSVCAVAMIVIIAVAAHGVWYAKPSTTAEREQVLAAAKKCMAAANTYNYKTLPADEKRGLACTTGAWTTQYKSALDKIVKPTAVKLKASQTVQINAAGVESVSGSGRQWTTIVYGQLTINQSGATPRIDRFAAIVRLDKVKSRYLVSKIDLITNPDA